MEKKNYAYLTKAGILKVVENPNTAKEAMGVRILYLQILSARMAILL